MFSKAQLSKLVHKVTRIRCTDILSRRCSGAISAHKLLQNDDHKTQSGFSRKGLSRISKTNLFIPIRLHSDSKPLVILKAIMKDLNNIHKAPQPALLLGFWGLIPFMIPPSIMIYTGVFVPNLAKAQIVYGACILAFIGGIRWGSTLPDNSPIPQNWKNLGCSILPSLLACFAPILPTISGLSLLIVGLTTTAVLDKQLSGYPSWFLGMRFILTFMACLSLLSTIKLVKMYELTSNQKSEVTKTDDDVEKKS